MISSKPVFYSLLDDKSWSSRMKTRHMKFINSCCPQENCHPAILKKSIKIVHNLKLKSLNGVAKDFVKMSNTVNILCKKRLGVKNLKTVYRAIPICRGKGPFFGFKMLKDLETLDLDLVLYPRRSKQDLNWQRAFQYLLNGSKKMKRLLLTFRNSYCNYEELKQCFSRVIRLKSLQDFRFKISNPPINGNIVLKGIFYLLGKMPHLKSFGLKGGYSGLKVSAEAYRKTLVALYKHSELRYLNLDFDIVLKDKNPHTAGQKDWPRLCNRTIESLILNVRIWDEIFMKLSGFLDSLRGLKELQINLIHKDQMISPVPYHEWAELAASITRMNNLQNLSIEYQYARRLDHEQQKKGSIMDWFKGFCSKRNRKEGKEEQYNCVLCMLLSIPASIKSIKKLNIQFPSKSYPCSIISINQHHKNC